MKRRVRKSPQRDIRQNRPYFRKKVIGRVVVNRYQKPKKLKGKVWEVVKNAKVF